MQGCPRRRAVGACDEPTARRGGQPVFDAQALAGFVLDEAHTLRRCFVPTSVPPRWLPRALAARRPAWDPQPSGCRKTQTGYRV